MKIDKKLIIGLAIIAALGVSIYFIVDIFITDEKTEGTEQEFQGNAKEELPNNPNAKENPVLYDFVYSSIGYMSDIKPESFGGISYAVLINKDTIESDDIKEGTAHILKVNLGDIFPPVSSGIESIKFEAQKWSLIKESLDDWPEDREFDAVDYKLFIVSQSKGTKSPYTYDPSTKGSMWHDIDLATLDYPDGWLANHIDEGWPTSWLRKEPYNSKIMEYHEEDIDSEFFDEFRMSEIITLNKRNSDNQDTRKVKVVGDNKFKTINKPIWKMSLQQMNAQLKEEGYNTIDR